MVKCFKCGCVNTEEYHCDCNPSREKHQVSLEVTLIVDVMATSEQDAIEKAKEKFYENVDKEVLMDAEVQKIIEVD